MVCVDRGQGVRRCEDLCCETWAWIVSGSCVLRCGDGNQVCGMMGWGVVSWPDWLGRGLEIRGLRYSCLECVFLGLQFGRGDGCGD
jgi:hypothetical protein